MKLKLRDDLMYVVLDPVEERKVGSLYVPDMHSEPTRIGTVKEVGPTEPKYPVGTRVLLSYYSGIAIDSPRLTGGIPGQDIHRIVKPDDILAEIIE